VISAEIPADLDFYRAAFKALGAAPGLTHDHPLQGIFLDSAVTPGGARFVHALNFDGIDKEVHFFDRGEALCEGRPVMLRRRDGVMLPFGVDLGGAVVAWSTAEIIARDERGFSLRLTGEADAIALRTSRTIAPTEAHTITTRADGVLVTSRMRGAGEDVLRIDWA
jgi:hypothetical protein